MEYVCEALNNGAKWWFDEAQYIRKLPDGEVTARIFGKDLPDPHKITADRTAIAKMPGNEGFRKRATNSVYKLWEHYNDSRTANEIQ